MALKNYSAQLFCPSLLPPHLSPHSAPGQYHRFQLHLVDVLKKQILATYGTDAQLWGSGIITLEMISGLCSDGDLLLSAVVDKVLDFWLVSNS